jgi:hypothetical protein
MTTQPFPDWSFGPRAAFWPHHEQRSGLSGFGDRPVLHEAWREPPAEPRRSPPVRGDAKVIRIDRFRAAA